MQLPLTTDGASQVRVNAGLKSPTDSKNDRLRDWVYGSEDFLKRVLSMANGEDPASHRRRVRRESDPGDSGPRQIAIADVI